MQIQGVERGHAGIGVYVHIPFCRSKCPYCDFASSAGLSVPEEVYVGCVLAELSTVVREEGLGGLPIDTLYIGGGTPTLFSPRSVKRLVEGVMRAFEEPSASRAVEPEVTIEANPGTITRSYLDSIRRAGVNRISIGVQSFDDRDLVALGRSHTRTDALDAVTGAVDAGFDEISVDLIFGVPGQTTERFLATLEEVVRLAPAHVSIYGLTIEESTPFHDLYGAKGAGGAGTPPLPGEASELEMFSAAIELLTGAGYERYEISNFAHAGHRSRHNQRYWTGLDYIGLGAGAHSYLSGPAWGRRWWNVAEPQEYASRVENTGRAQAGAETLTRGEALLESVMLGLRMLETGIDVRSFAARFGSEPAETFFAFEELGREGFLESRDGHILLTGKGALFSNEVFLRLFAVTA